MEKQTISFRLDPEKLEALAAIAKAMERDRTFVLNEAVRSYLDIQEWQMDHIKAGLAMARFQQTRKRLEKIALAKIIEPTASLCRLD